MFGLALCFQVSKTNLTFVNDNCGIMVEELDKLVHSLMLIVFTSFR